MEAWMSKEGVAPYKDLPDVHNASILYNGMLSPVLDMAFGDVYGIRGKQMWMHLIYIRSCFPHW